MGVDHTYFAARGDADAAAAGSRPGGPLGGPTVTGTRRIGWFRREPVTVELGPAWPGFTTRGWEPTVLMGTLEELLTVRPYDDVAADPRFACAPGTGPDDADDVVVTLTDTLRDALAAASDERLHEVAASWRRTEELQQPRWEATAVEEHVGILRRLRDLARRAAADGHRLYCHVEL
ncbi:hypothetical protein [Geodermatophilus chilensis]|uniref:hypothetical protein n=1 Tax=Geodermatophilus chilensis TaxID=2035835 RepID=UPI000C25E480|nr:hypothetical protein [Geodermatophilus chilensis]